MSSVSPTRLLGVAMAACAAFLLWETRGHLLLYDEWSFFADYRGHGPEVLLNPFGDNLELLPILAYKAVFELFGPEPLALRLLLVGLDLTTAALIFVLVRDRVGPWIALAVAVLVMLLGAAADVVAATLGLAIMSAVTCGLGALVALERRSVWGDRAACALLTAALASNSVGLPFLAGAAVDVLFVRREQWRRRLWIVAVPAVLYAAWRLWSFQLDPLGPLAAHPTEITLSNIGTLPGSIAESLAAAAVTITGLFRDPGDPGPNFSTALGPAAVLGLAALAAMRVRFGPPLDRRILVLVAMPLVYWVLIGLVVSDRLPSLPRYQVAGGIFLLLLLAELGRGVRFSPRATAVVVAALAVAALPNVINLHDSSKFLRYNGQLNRAELFAIELAAESSSPPPEGLLIEPIGGVYDPASPSLLGPAGVPDVTTDAVISAGRYLRAAEDFGSAAYSEEELLESPAGAREAADRELGAAYTPMFAPIAQAGAASCRRLPAGDETEIELLPGGGIALRSGQGDQVSGALRRFGDAFAIELGPAPAGTASELAMPADASSVPWALRLEHAQPVTVCDLGRPR